MDGLPKLNLIALYHIEIFLFTLKWKLNIFSSSKTFNREYREVISLAEWKVDSLFSFFFEVIYFSSHSKSGINGIEKVLGFLCASNFPNAILLVAISHGGRIHEASKVFCR